MSILLDKNTRVMVQGITGRTGRIQAKYMLEYGTNIVAGVTPGKGGQYVEGVPVYNSPREAVVEKRAEAAVFFVPPAGVKEAVIQNIDAGIGLIVVVTEHVPIHDVMEIREYAMDKEVRIIGPTSPGIITVGEAKIGIMPGSMFKPGRIGLISRSGTLSYEVSGNLAKAGYGQSTVVGIGADPVVFTNLPEILLQFEKDSDTDLVVLVGELGGSQEENAAAFIKRSMTKPVVAYITGLTAPQGKKMGHAGAIVNSELGKGTAQSKVAALKNAGVDVARFPADVIDLVKKHLQQ